MAWQFVAEAESIDVGQSLRYQAPTGETINIARQARDGESGDFIALSKVSSGEFAMMINGAAPSQAEVEKAVAAARKA